MFVRDRRAYDLELRNRSNTPKDVLNKLFIPKRKKKKKKTSLLPTVLEGAAKMYLNIFIRVYYSVSNFEATLIYRTFTSLTCHACRDRWCGLKLLMTIIF